MAVMSGIVSRNPQMGSHSASTSGGLCAHTKLCAPDKFDKDVYMQDLSRAAGNGRPSLQRGWKWFWAGGIKKTAVQTFMLRFWVWHERAAAIVCWAASPAGLMENCQHQDNRPRMSQNWQARRRVHVNCRAARWLKREISYLCKTDITNGQSRAWEKSLGTI